MGMEPTNENSMKNFLAIGFLTFKIYPVAKKQFCSRISFIRHQKWQRGVKCVMDKFGLTSYTYQLIATTTAELIAMSPIAIATTSYNKG